MESLFQFLLLATTTTTTLLLILLPPPVYSSDPSSSSPIPQTTLKSPPLEFASPLQSFTIFDPKTEQFAKIHSPRSKFLPRFRAGLAAEQKIRDRIYKEKELEEDDDDDDNEDGRSASGVVGGERWAEMSAAAEDASKKKEERRIERAYDRATALYDEKQSSKATPLSEEEEEEEDTGKYQFVGVINPSSSSSSKSKNDSIITWYARKKPKGSKWSLRLIRADRNAIVRDLHVRGKVDVYGQYVNKGVPEEQIQMAKERGLGVVVDERPVLEGRYTVRERSWRTLWNFNPKRFFSDSSGMFWRERRLSPGLYTDGRVVYESVYRYKDGKNGMKPVSLLSQFLASPAVEEDVKEKIMERLKVDSPDVVIED